MESSHASQVIKCLVVENSTDMLEYVVKALIIVYLGFGSYTLFLLLLPSSIAEMVLCDEAYSSHMLQLIERAWFCVSRST